MIFLLSLIERCTDVQGEAGKRVERLVRSPAPTWLSLASSSVLLLGFGAVLWSWIPFVKKHQRPLFRIPLTKAGQCLAGYHNLVRTGQGVFVCQVCNLTCACPYCVSHIPAGVPFVNCAYHQDAYLELQDAVLPTTAITLNGRRI